MHVGYIDSASLTDAVGALISHRKYHPQNYYDWNEWTANNIIDTVTRIITYDKLEVAPPPSLGCWGSAPYSTLTSCYDIALTKLQILVKPQRPPGDICEAVSNHRFKNWLAKDADKIPTIIAKTKEEASFPKWINWAITEAWVDHSNRQSGLFNENIIPNLSLALDVSQEKLRALLIKTRDPVQVKKWSEGQDLSRDFYLAREAYVASSILRGKFHEEIASVQHIGRTRHPIRKYVPIDIDPSHVVNEYAYPTALNYLVNIINKNALKETNPNDRISLWVDNISLARDAYQQRKLDDAFYWDQNLDEIEILKIIEATVDKIGLRLYRKCLVDIFEYIAIVGIGLAEGAVISYFNIPWLSATLGVSSPVGYTIWRLEKGKEIGKYLAEMATKSLRKEDSLRDLAKAPPGLVIR